MNTTTRFIAVATGVVAAVAMLAAPGSAATAPAVTVDPATGLSDGQRVAVAATGFPGETEMRFYQCEKETNRFRCNVIDNGSATSDAGGNSRASMVVRRVFQAVDMASNEPAGTVDCAASGCMIGATTIDGLHVATAEVSFR